MPNEPFWVTPDGVVQLNRNIVGDTGEPHSLRDRGLLESACDRPKNLWHYESEADVATLAASLLFGIARNHPFEQGNKRTAFEAMIGFLGANSYRFNMYDDDRFADSITAVLAGTETEVEFTDRVRRLIEKVDLHSWR